MKFNFNGGDLTSDAGLLLIQEFIHQIKFPQLLKHFFHLDNDQAIRTHTNHDLCLQHILQTIAGYHCADDEDELRVEPLFTTLLKKKSLVSQPTLSRFYHRLTKETSKQLEHVNQQVLHRFYQIQTPEHFIFDVDSTHFQPYGHQYGNGFNAHYQSQGFHPLMVFDGITGDYLKVELRAGNVYTSRNVVSFLGPLLSRYQKEFRSVYRIVQVRRKAGELIPEYLFLVTNMETRPELVLSLYAKLGTMENYIKECKNGFRMDKVSHKNFMTNINRIQQIVLAYNLINGFRRLTLPTDYQKMKIETLRTKFIKIAAKRVKQARRIIFKLCSHYPYKEIFNQCLRNIHAIQLE